MTSLSLFTFTRWRRKWQPTPVFLPGESHGQWSLAGCRQWSRKELDRTEGLRHTHTGIREVRMAASSHSREGAFVQIQEKGFWQRQPTFLKRLCIRYSRFMSTTVSDIGSSSQRKIRERPVWRCILCQASRLLVTGGGGCALLNSWARFCLSKYLWRAGVGLRSDLPLNHKQENSNWSEFPGLSVATTLSFHHRGPGCNSSCGR